jgi:8-amino-7-oxononanoate synthase
MAVKTVSRPLLKQLAGRDLVIRARDAIAGGVYPYFRTVTGLDAGRLNVDGRPVIMLASNDYLDLRFDPRVKKAAVAAVEQYGVGAAGSRLMAGSVSLHGQLEEALADWTGREDALIFTSGYQANVGVISALLSDGTVALCESAIHASLIDGCVLSGAQVRTFRRQSLAGLRHRLGITQGEARAVLVDAVYSMDGDTLRLDEIAGCLDECGAEDAVLIVDEAHALGLLGRQGGGLATDSAAGERVDIVTGTLSKSLASCGGFVAGPRDVIAAIRTVARSLIFSTAGVPAALGAALAALRIAQEEPERAKRVLGLASRLRDGLSRVGLSTGASDSAIVPIAVGDETQAVIAGQLLFGRGIYAGVAIHPAVPASRAILRFSVTAALSPADIDYCVEAVSASIAEARLVTQQIGSR